MGSAITAQQAERIKTQGRFHLKMTQTRTLEIDIMVLSCQGFYLTLLGAVPLEAPPLGFSVKGNESFLHNGTLAKP